MSLLLSSLNDELKLERHLKSQGRVISTQNPVIFAKMPHASIGDACQIIINRTGHKIETRLAQVIAFNQDLISILPFDHIDGICPGATVVNSGSSISIPISEALIGQVIDPLGNPLGAATKTTSLQDNLVPLLNTPPCPLTRKPIDTLMPTGISAIDGMCSIGYGQRVGLFASAGVGKSTLLAMLARNCASDVNVIALVGERGREVNEFIYDTLGQEGLSKSIVVVATSDDSPMKRSLAATSATAIAEYFRSQGKRVLLLVDSLTRVARAIRDVGLACGELPVRQGYTTSVYIELPRLLERAGTASTGSITAIYTVLMNDENESDPLAHEIKSLLDGHLVLSSAVAQSGIRPALDISASISRLSGKLHDHTFLNHANLVVEISTRLKEERDILLLGGTPDKKLKACLYVEERLKQLLSQRPGEIRNIGQTKQEIENIANIYQQQLNKPLSSD